MVPARRSDRGSSGLSKPTTAQASSLAGAAQALDPVVAVLEHQLVVAVGDDDGRRLPALLDLLAQVVDVVAPLVLVDLDQHRVAGGPASRWSWSSGSCTGPSHLRGGSVEGVAERGVVAARGWRGTRRPSRRARRVRRPRRAASTVKSSRSVMPPSFPVGRSIPSRGGRSLGGAGRAGGRPRCRSAASSGRAGVVLPLGEPGVGGPQVRARPAWAMPSSTRIDAMITPAWHTATTVWPAWSPASRSSVPCTRSWKLFQLSPPGANTRSGSASMSKEP